MDSRYMNKADAAKYLTVTPKTLDNMRRRGELACVRIGSRVVFDKVTLDAFMRDRVEKAEGGAE